MATPPGYMHRPTIARPLEELDRRLSVIEFGDPGDIKGRADALDVLYANEVATLNYAGDGLATVNYDLQRIGSWVHEVALFYAHQHEYSFHNTGQPYPTAPATWTATPLPVKPELIDPT